MARQCPKRDGMSDRFGSEQWKSIIMKISIFIISRIVTPILSENIGKTRSMIVPNSISLA